MIRKRDNTGAMHQHFQTVLLQIITVFFRSSNRPCLHLVLRLVLANWITSRQGRLFTPGVLISLFWPLSTTFLISLKGGSMGGCMYWIFLIVQSNIVK